MRTCYERWLDARSNSSSAKERDLKALVERRGGVCTGREFVQVLQMLGYKRHIAGGIAAKVERIDRYGA